MQGFLHGQVLMLWARRACQAVGQAGQKAAILGALEPTSFAYVHFVLESAYA